MGLPESGEESERRRRPRIVSWLSGRGTTFAWLLPIGVVAITGWLGSLNVPLLLASWLAAIGGAGAGVIANLALEPASYAGRTAATLGAVIGVALLLLVSWQAGVPILD